MYFLCSSVIPGVTLQTQGPTQIENTAFNNNHRQ